MDYDYGNLSQRAKAGLFIAAIKDLSRQHGCWLSHEDGVFGVVVDPVPIDVKTLSCWMEGTEVNAELSTGCSHTWVPKWPDSPFDTCSSCGASRRHIPNEVT